MKLIHMAAVGESRRLELVHDLVIKCKEVVRAILQQLWTRTSSDKAIPKTRWLQEFQLSLKSIRDFSDDLIEQYIDQHVRRKRTTHHLYAALQATAHAFHRKKLSNLREDPSILVHFVRECALETARAVWYKPYLFFNMSFQKHLVVQAVEEYEAMVVKAIEHVVRQFTDELVLAEQVAIAKVAPLLKGGSSSISSGGGGESDLDSELVLEEGAVAEESEHETEAEEGADDGGDGHGSSSLALERADSISSRASWEQARDQLLDTFVPLKQQKQEVEEEHELPVVSPRDTLDTQDIPANTTRIVSAHVPLSPSPRRVASGKSATLSAYARYLPTRRAAPPRRNTFFK